VLLGRNVDGSVGVLVVLLVLVHNSVELLVVQPLLVTLCGRMRLLLVRLVWLEGWLVLLLERAGLDALWWDLLVRSVGVRRWCIGRAVSRRGASRGSGVCCWVPGALARGDDKPMWIVACWLGVLAVCGLVLMRGVGDAVGMPLRSRSVA
jgi:hypothetical protein